MGRPPISLDPSFEDDFLLYYQGRLSLSGLLEKHKISESTFRSRIHSYYPEKKRQRGRPEKKIDPMIFKEEIRLWHDGSQTQKECIRKLGISRATLYRLTEKLNDRPGQE